MYGLGQLRITHNSCIGNHGNINLYLIGIGLVLFCFVIMAILSLWQYCHYGNIVIMAILSLWQYHTQQPPIVSMFHIVLNYGGLWSCTTLAN